MQGSFQVAQATGTGNSTNSAPVRIYKLTKPLTDQAVVVNLGYDQKVKVDFSSIANEKITLVHVGEKLIILFDNQSTVTVEPFFDSRADGQKNVTIEMAPGREVSVQEFATLFPISTDASVLPAADNGGNSNGNAQASGANFSPFAIDPLAPVPTNVLAPQEELPNLVTPPPPTGFVLGVAPPPIISGNPLSALIVDESFLTAATNHGVAGSGLGPAGATVASVQVSFNVTVPGGQQSLTYALSVTTPNEDSGLIDSATGQHVLLTVNAAGVVEGRTAIGGDLVLTVSVDATGHVTLTDLRAVHEATPGNFNEGITLASGLITLTATVTDNNNQSASASVDVGSHLTILDDGPVAGTVTGATDTLVLDETRPVGSDTAGGTTPTGLASVTADFSNNFTGGSYGADGAGSTAYTLHLTGTNVASGLYALDPTDTNPAHFGQGAQIVLNQSGDTITGSANGTIYFTITINETTGIVTFTQVNNIWHADPTNPDDAATLTLSSASLLQVVQTITDVDGDSVTTPINLGGGVFTIQDSGPTAGTVIQKEGPAETLVLDESRPVGSDTPGGFAPSGLASVTADFSHDFTSGSYGSDGPGHTAYTLKLTGSNVASGLYALDPTDTTTADGDGIGQGAQIVLNQSGNTITGSAGGTTYFTITIDPSTGIVTFTQSNNIWHSDPKNPDDPATLTLSSPSLLQVVQTITDADGDSVSTPLNVGTRVFTIQDSGPTAGTVTGATDTLVLDETRPVGTDTAGGTAPTGLDSVTADFSNNFTPGSYGSDGPGHTTYTLNLAGANVASGLYALDATDTTTADGDGIGQGAQILLNQVGNTITGSAGGTNYFTITIDPSTGIVTFTQLNNIWHSDPTNPDDAATLTLSGANLLRVVQTIVDADGDSVTTPLDVGTGVFTIQDSGPTAGTVIAAADTLVLDETRPVGTDTAGGATPTGLDSVTADFSNNFSAGSYGSDGPGNTAYTLKLTGVNVASGLYALDPTDKTAGDGDGIGQGTQIVLNQVGDTITGSANGTTYFTITIDETTGIVTFTQVNNIWHSDPTNPDDAATLTLSSANLLQVVQTITDADGDSVSTPLDVGTSVFTIQDSGPTAGTVAGPTDTLVLDETRPVGIDTAGGTAPTGLDTVTADFSNNFTGGNYGSDGAGNTAYTLKLTGANVASGLYALDPTDKTAGDGDGIGQGTQIVLNQVGDTITGSAGGTNYFTITIDETTGIVTFTQLNNIWHSDPTNPDDAATLTLSAANLLQVVQTITDADGDHVSTPLDLGTGVFTIQDSGPTASTLSGATDTLVLDETRPVGSDTAGGTAPTGLDTVTADFSNGFAGGSYGSDGPGNSAYTLKLTGANVASGLYALDATDTTAGDGDGIGQGAQIVLNQVGNTITGSAGGTDYFTITIDPSTGIVTFTQLNNIWHSDPTNPDDAATLTLTRPELLQLVQTITDADGDSVTTSLNLGTGVFTIQDSGPTAGTVIAAADTLVLDETRPVGSDTAGGTAPAGLDTVTADFSNNFSAGSYGSDGAGNTTYTLKLTGANVASGLFALDATDTTTADGDGIGQGAQILLNQVGNTITGSVGGTNYFTITIDPSTGIVTFTQLNNIWHSDPTNPDDSATLTLSAANLLQVVQTITDADGDSVTTPLDVGTGVFTIQDSGPTAGTVTGPTDTLVLDETRPTGTDTAGGTAPTGLDTVTADFSNNFTGGNYGSDGAGSTTYTLKLTGANVASGLYALDPTDKTAGDGDGIGQGTQIVLNQVGDTITGSANGTTYFTITINETTGIVTFTQVNNIWHSDPTNPDDAATLTLSAANLLQVVQTITDADGDSVTTPIDVGTGVFAIQDSGPTAGTVTGPTDTLVLDETRPVGSDTAAGTAPTGLDTVTADFSNNFTGGNYGSDGAGSTTYTLKLTGANVASGLYALDPTDKTAGDGDGIGQGTQIVLNQVGDTITGSANGTTYFTITINETTGIVTFTQVNNIWHSDPTNPDDAATLTLSAANLLQVVQTITDADGDSVSTPLDLGTGVFTIQDSGPTAGTVTGPTDTLVLDETRPVGSDTAGGTAPTGLDTVTADFSNNFTAGNYGSDGAGSTTYTLKLTGLNVASGLYALDPTDKTAGDGDGIGQGTQIVLNQVGDTITGSANGTTYFTITINETTGIVTFTQVNNIWHSDPTNPDDAATLTLTRPELLQVVQTITDADGDSVATPINVGTGVFTIQDSGPTAGTVTGPTDTLVLDETRPVGSDTAGGTAPTGLDTVTADFSNNFTGGNYGSDGAGSTTYTLKLTGLNVASGLYALDPTDKTAGDGDGIGQGTQIVLNQVGDTITGSANGTTYFTITINETTGIVTFTQVNNIWHSDPTNPDDAATLTLSSANLLQVVQTITDADGDSVSTPLDLGTGVFTIQDSGPTAGTVTGPTDTLVLDETRPTGTDTAGGTAPTGLDTVTADFSNNFTAGSYGSDGAGSTTYTLKLTGANVASGLYALDPTDKTAGDGDGIGQGTQIVLNQVGDTITGSANGTTYFTITINETTGIVTFTQVNNIWHSDPTNPDDAATLTLSAANLLQVVQTITDADGDSVSTPLDLGTGVFTIQDSGPTAGTVTGPTDTLVLDETRPTGTDTAGGTAPTGLDTVTADFSNNFTAGSYGSDGAGSTTYTLKLTGSNVASGLYALDPTDKTAGDGDGIGQGTQIVLNQVGDTITGSANGTTYFTITINETTGIVTFTQVNNIWHSDPTNPDDSATLTLSAANLLQVVQTITDADGDSVATPLNVGTGVFTIQDSGPTAGTVTGPTDTLVLDETRPVGSDTAGGTAPTGLDTVTADFSNNFTAGSYGSDGAGSTTYTLKLTGANVASGLYALDPTDKTAGDGDGIGQGTQIVLNQVGDTITGSANGTTYFTITINETTGIVTFTQVNNIWHSDPTNPDDAATLTLSAANLLQVVQTITDADGDSVATPINVGTGVFTIQDSGPTAGTVTGPTDTLVLDETRPVGSDTAGGAAPTGLDTVTADFSNNFTGGSYGSDGAGSTTYTLKLTGANVASGLYALDPTDKTAGDGDGIGQGAQIVLNQVGNTITGSVGGTNYFTITIDPSTGIVTFTQLNNIWHSDPTNPDDAATLTLSAANLLQVVQTITDADGDSVTTPLNLGTGVFTIQDSGPTAGTVTGPTDTLVLDETRPVGSDTAGGTAPNGLVSVTANFSDNFTGGSYGSDGAGSTTYTLKLTGSNVASGLYALDATDKTAGDGDGIGQGAQILLSQSGNTITGSVGATTYFTITIDPATGIVTFTQVNNVWHSDPNNPDDAATLTLSSANLLQVVQTIVDADGDSVSTPLDLGAGVFTIQDSGPTAPTATVSAATIGVDETPGVQTIGGASDVLGSTAITFNGAASTVAALFSTVANKGVDTDVSAASLDNGALSFASTGASSILTVAGGSFGSDGAGSTTYALSVLSAASGLTLTDGTGIALSLDASGRIIGTVGNDVANPSLTGQTAFAIAIDPITGQLYVADYLSLHHNSTASSNDLLTMTAGKIGATVTLTDADGDHVTATADISTHISFLDDGPSFGTIEHGIIADYAGMSVVGNLPVFSGADGFGAYDFTLTGNTAPAGLTFNGQAVHYSIDALGQNLTAYIGAAPSAANNIFTLNLDDTTGHYLFTLLQPFTETTIQNVGSSSSFGSGPSEEQILSSNTDQLAVVSGTTSGGGQGGVNGSTSGWGVDNNNFDPNEKLLFDFTSGAIASPVGNAAFHPPANESVANYTFSHYAGGDKIHYVVSYWDGVHAASITSVSGDFDPSTHTTVATEWSTPTAPAGLQLYTVQFTDVTGSGKVDLVGVGVSSTTNVSEDLSFNVSTIDGDGDTASSTINININGTTTLMGTAGNDVIVAGPTNETLTGNGGDDKFVLNLSAHEIISDFNSGDTLLLDVAGLSLPTGASNALTAGQFTSSAVTGQTENNASAWNESASTNKFFFNNTTQELWYSANGTGSDKVDLAHVSTGLPAATNVHIF